MQISKFVGRTARETLGQVRAALGQNAVILRNQSTPEGVVILAVEGDAEALDREQDHLSPTSDLGDDDNGVMLSLQGMSAQRTPAAQHSGVSPPELPPPALSNGTATVLAAGPDVKSGPALRTVENPYSAEALQPSANATAAERNSVYVTQQGKHTQRGAGASSRLAERRLDDVGAELRALRELVENQMGALAWQSCERRNPLKAEAIRLFSALGLRSRVCVELLSGIEPHNCQSFDEFWEQARRSLTEKIRVNAVDSLLDDGGLVGLVGPTGSGKTTTAAKLAGQFVLEHGPGSAAMVTCDDFRLGAHEQLEAVGRLLDVPVLNARGTNELLASLAEVSDRKLVIIDTEGISAQSTSPYQQLGTVRNNFPALVVKTVIAANSQYRCMRRAMPDTDIRDGDGIILTKVDEAASLGEALSALLRGPLPLSFVCDGQAVPNDLHIACASVLVGAAESLSHSSADDIDDDWFGSQAGQAMMRG